MTSEADNLAAVSVKTRRRTDFLSSGNISCFDNNTYESTSAGEAPPRSITARPSFHSPLDSFHSFHSQPLFAISRYFSLAGPRGDWTYDDPNGIRFTKRETNLQRKSCKKSARRPGAAITPSALGLLPRALRRASVQDPQRTPIRAVFSAPAATHIPTCTRWQTQFSNSITFRLPSRVIQPRYRPSELYELAKFPLGSSTITAPSPCTGLSCCWITSSAAA